MNESDLDGLADQALKWQKVLIENFAKIATLQLEKKDLQKSLADANQQIHTSRSESSQLLDQIGSLQNIVTQRCDFQAENRELKDKMIEKEKKFLAEIGEQESKFRQLQETMKTQETEFREQLKEQEAKSQEKAVEEKTVLERKLEEKCAELAELQQSMSQQEADHYHEMDKIKKEFEDRLVKLKEQTTNLQNLASYNACKDIFRKKWDHAKAQYENEITNLRTQITSLETRLRGQPRAQTQPRTPGQSRPQAAQARPQNHSRPLPAPRPRPPAGRGSGRGQNEFQAARPGMPDGPPSKKRK